MPHSSRKNPYILQNVGINVFRQEFLLYMLFVTQNYQKVTYEGTSAQSNKILG